MIATERPAAPGQRQGFTLIELMVVIAVIAVLMGLLLPAVRRVQDTAKDTTCRKNLHELFTACTMYAADHDGFYPFHSPEPASSAGLLFPRYVDQARIFYCPVDQSPVPTTIDMTLTGAAARGHNGAQMSYDSHLNLALTQDSSLVIDGHQVSSTTPMLWDWYGGLEPGEGTAEQRALNNHRFTGGNVVFRDGHVKWVTAQAWSDTGSDRLPGPSR